MYYSVLETNYRALLQKMTHKDKVSYGSSPPCTKNCLVLFWHTLCYFGIHYHHFGIHYHHSLSETKNVLCMTPHSCVSSASLSLLIVLPPSFVSLYAVNTEWIAVGWLRLVGSLNVLVSFAEYCLFYRALLQKRPVILRSLLYAVNTEWIAMHSRICTEIFAS